jgi:ribosome-binding factor A
MKPRRSVKGLDAFCGEVHADDGVDPRELFSWGNPGKRRNGKSNRKDLQLAKQVFRAIDATLRGESTDSVLQDLEVVSVEPAPDATHFLVTVQLTTLRARVSLSLVLERLERASRLLRHEVALAITRKRAPEISFHVIGGKEECP